MARKRAARGRGWLERMARRVTNWSGTSQAFAQKLYENTATENAGQYDQGDGTGAGANGADDDDVVDAEVIDEDEAQ